jgi:hypothetical protein
MKKKNSNILLYIKYVDALIANVVKPVPLLPKITVKLNYFILFKNSNN